MKKKILFALIFCLVALFIQAQKPVIGISVSRTASGGSTVSANYVNAVLKAGGLPLLIPAMTDSSAVYELTNTIDGLIMTGGEDVNPLLYGEEPLPGLGEVDGERDRYEILLVKSSAKRKIPILGICRGEQIINVIFGGTLYQDIPSQRDTVVKHRQDLEGRFASHSVEVAPGTKLAEIIGAGSHAVNSFHHQAVKRLAPVFRLSATASDGVVEAYEAYPTLPIIAVQWHPEMLITGNSPEMLNLFRFLAVEAETYRKNTP
ncbi:MAG: gamma-glutamyl-gamma-aminobutyrate hydrolase family protein [Dysgonamonadaceae bacterium]|jgi:gamma-glutamyl-gamma-aminobutyrate hydrolase PuuD|nr:gamma-glutamyl-gamma-aminobutyrate hydrolase family protein [Dysgonamonadaceae bacterium]